MPARNRVGTRVRTTSRARGTPRAQRGRGARVTSRGRSVNRELGEVLNAQVESSEELRNTKVPIATEPAFVFRA